MARFFLDKDLTMQITHALNNMFCIVHGHDSVTEPHYDLGANKHVNTYVCMYVRTYVCVCVFVCMGFLL